MIRRYSTLLALVAFAPLAASAEGGSSMWGHTDSLSYSYFQAQYLKNKMDLKDAPAGSFDDGGEGLRLGFNVSLMNYLYFAADYDQRLYQCGKACAVTPIRWSYGSAGFGAHTRTLLNIFQFFGTATYEQNVLHDRDDSNLDETDDGYGAEAGVRLPLPNLELHAAYKYMNLGKTEDGTAKVTGDRYGGGMLIQLTPYWGLTGDWRRIDRTEKDATGAGGKAKWQLDEWLVGFRWYFATDIERYKRRGGLLTGLLGAE